MPCIDDCSAADTLLSFLVAQSLLASLVTRLPSRSLRGRRIEFLDNDLTIHCDDGCILISWNSCHQSDSASSSLAYTSGESKGLGPGFNLKFAFGITFKDGFSFDYGFGIRLARGEVWL